jgi:uncharacterized SAM-binding protein YcdF (DUF218 family)
MPAMIADWLASHGLGIAKPLLSALALPPTPLLAVAFAGAWIARTRPRTGRWMTGLACMAAWLASTTGAAQWLEAHALHEPPALGAPERAALRARAAAGEPVAIVVLGGGMTDVAPEYGRPDLAPASLSRLRYAVWLARQTGLPVAASGGRGWAGAPSIPPEATRMAEIAQEEWRVPLRWTESTSRDTRENAVNTLALLRPAGIREIVLVTHGVHMPRALREFNAAAAGPAPVRVTPAPMGQAESGALGLLDWMPSGEGARQMHAALHEVLAAVGGRR